MMVRSYPALLLCLASVLACGPKQQPTTSPEPGPAEPAAPPVDPIPAEFGALTPEMIVPDIQAALDFYGSAFGAQTISTLEGPDGNPIHAEIKIGDSMIILDMGSNNTLDPARENMKDPMALGGSPVTLMLYVEDADAAFDNAVQAGAVVNMPLEDQFWGDRYGDLIDPFGHAWAVATHIEDLTAEQLEQRAALIPPPSKKKKRRKKGKPKWAEIVGTPATQKVPEGYHTVTMALTVSSGAEAIDYYVKAFGANERGRLASPDGRLIHAELEIGGDILMLSDENPVQGTTSAKTLGGSPVMLHHYVTDADSTFGAAVSNGGTEMMALEDTLWGDRYGALVDPTGLPWGVATHKEDVSLDQIKERMAAAGGGTPAEAEPAEAAAEPAT
ncbi:MAG: VOC family protein [Myxococcota bacterium]